MNTTHHHSTDTTHNAGGSSRTLQAPTASREEDRAFELRVAQAVTAIELGNNGYAVIGPSVAVAKAVEARGFVVIASRDLHGNPTYKGFTRASQEALRTSDYGVCTYKAINTVAFAPVDVEAQILARQSVLLESL